VEWGELERELEGRELSNEEDSIRWVLNPYGQFTTSSRYMHWSFPEVKDVVMEELWQSKLPLKIKNFMWLVHRNRLQTTNNLGRKQWKGNKFYQFCHAKEC
jgi:hypothetical protein